MPTQTTVQQPPAFQLPYLEDLLRQAQFQYLNFTPQYFPGNTVAPLSPYTQQAIQSLAGFGGSQFNQDALARAQQAQASLAGGGPLQGIAQQLLQGSGQPPPLPQQSQQAQDIFRAPPAGGGG